MATGERQSVKAKSRCIKGRMRRFKMNLIGVPERIVVVLSYCQFKYILAENFLELMKGLDFQLQEAQ